LAGFSATAPPPQPEPHVPSPTPSEDDDLTLRRVSPLSADSVESYGRKGVRSSERLRKLASNSKKDKALFSPHFIRLRKKRGNGDSDTSEPVTPESQLEHNLELDRITMKSKKSLAQALEKESGSLSPEDSSKEPRRFYCTLCHLLISFLCVVCVFLILLCLLCPS